MMSENSAHYTVLARRFRPQTFEEVIGQQHVGQSLQNAIRSGRVAHAYLFTGARGVGKTSMARILAKALNCPQAKDGIPCNECEICRGISAGHDVDVPEIDGASNRGIDDVRSLRANVNVKSMRTRFKIYIIDEVHMLTRDAFNALLKTLEEPPPSVKFVFCTTEPNKLPDTILSRCQRFDFSTIETTNIISRLQQIAEAEGFAVQPEALELVARRAAGSMRDSQSLFDQLLAFGGETISADDVHRLFGTADDQRLIALVDALVAHRRDQALEQLDRALSDGVQLSELFNQLLYYLRDLMVIAVGAESVALLSVSAANRDQLARQGKAWGLQTIMAALEILSETKNRMFRAGYARALAESALIRISLLEELDRLTELIAEMKDGTCSAAPSAGGRSATRATAGAEKKTAKISESAVQSANVGEEPSAPVVEFEPGCEKALLAQVIANSNDVTKTHLRNSTIAISGPNQLDLMFPQSYHFSRQYCHRPEVLGPLEELLARLTGRVVRVSTRIVECEPAESLIPGDSPRAEVAGDSGAPERGQPKETAVIPPPHELEKDPFVRQAVDVFGGTIVKVEGLSAPPQTP